jgi:hypothetical protein
MANPVGVLNLSVLGAGGLFVTIACAKPDVEIRALPDGTRELTCRHTLPQCLSHVDDVCKGNSYEVLYATDTQKIYGSPSSNEVESRTSQAVVHCLGPHQKAMGEQTAAAGSAASAPPEGPAPVTALVAPAGPRVCVPGATQACVGIAGCTGGQACLHDGSGFGECDCGMSRMAPESVTPSAAPH